MNGSELYGPPCQVGLPGTCGQSTWRALYKMQLQNMGVSFFDPMVPAGSSYDSKVDGPREAYFLSKAPILFAVVTSETTGWGSLVEILIRSAFAAESGQQMAVVIEGHEDAEEMERRARVLRSARYFSAVALDRNTGFNLVKAMLESSREKPQPVPRPEATGEKVTFLAANIDDLLASVESARRAAVEGRPWQLKIVGDGPKDYLRAAGVAEAQYTRLGFEVTWSDS